MKTIKTWIILVVAVFVSMQSVKAGSTWEGMKMFCKDPLAFMAPGPLEPEETIIIINPSSRVMKKFKQGSEIMVHATNLVTVANFVTITNHVTVTNYVAEGGTLLYSSPVKDGALKVYVVPNK